MLPAKLEEQIPLFERDGKVGLVYSDIILFNEKGKEKRYLNSRNRIGVMSFQNYY